MTLALRGGYGQATEALRERTGVVVPVHFPEGLEPERGHRMLADVVLGLVREVAVPEVVCLSVDGAGAAQDVARDIHRRTGVQVVCSDPNRGKLHALRLGAERVLRSEGLQYLALVDQDGDHFPNELLNFVRAARHVSASAADHDDRVMVLGRRISRHRPLGFLRGELEELADRVLLDALQYDAARTGRPLALQFATSIEEFPDFHSGYKLLSLPVATSVLLGEPNLAGVAEACYYRHAVESVLVTEAIKASAWLAVVNRSTLDEQPASAFGLLDRRRLVADKMIWPCRRLGVPAAFADQWLRNHIPRLLLRSLAPEGPEELEGIWRLVLDGVDPAYRPAPGSPTESTSFV